MAVGRAAADEPKLIYDPDYPLVGETLGMWRLIRGLGRGGMGEVYEGIYDYLHLLTLNQPAEERGVIRAEFAALPRAEQAKLVQETLGTDLAPAARFAIKVCSARHGTAGHRRFLQEGELARPLGDHPYIVTVYSLHGGGDEEATGGDGSGHRILPGLNTGKHKDVAYMVMDLAEGDYKHDEVSIDDAVHITRCIATALDHAHRQGIVHRDLKPENILGGVDHPLLTDFGIAKELDQSLGLTRTGQVIGTLDYMSPEQATDAKNVDHRSDIYSLGVVLYEMATKGQLPYLHLAQREAALAAIRDERVEPKWPRQHRADFPRSLEAIILKAMAHRPEERYQQASEFLSDLDRYLRGEWILSLTRVHPRRFLRYLRNRYPKAIAIIAGMACALVLAWGILALKDSFDTKRQELELETTAFEQAVAAAVNDGGQQLDQRERGRFLTDLAGEVDKVGDEYPAIAERYAAAAQRLAVGRWLEASFAPESGVPVEAPAGRQQLALAFGDVSGTRAENEGLVCQRSMSWRAERPFGAGALYTNVLVDVPGDGFLLRLADSGQRTRTEVRIAGGRLTLSWQQDQLPPRVLYDHPVRFPFRLDFAVQVSDDEREGLRFYLPGMRRWRSVPVVGLRSGSPVDVSVDLPNRSVLKYIQILPRQAGG